MEANQKQTDESKMTFIVKCGWNLLVVGIMIILILYTIKLLRNNRFELSQRFVRNSEIIKEKTGGIFNTKFDQGIKSGNSWQMRGNVYGNNKNNLQVTVYLICRDGKSDSPYGCNITRAKYRNNNDLIKDWDDSDWHEIEVGWWENFMLTFK